MFTRLNTYIHNVVPIQIKQIIYTNWILSQVKVTKSDDQIRMRAQRLG